MNIITSKIDFRKLLKLLTVATFVLTIGFYYLFTYIRKSAETPAQPSKSAFNTKLPAPNLDDRYKNKLDIYMEAREDSLRQLKEQQKEALLFSKDAEHIQPDPAEDHRAFEGHPAGRMDANERKVAKAMEQLQKVLEQSTVPDSLPQTGYQVLPGEPSRAPAAADVAHLEKLMDAVSAQTADDKELQRLDGMLDKIREIQQPRSSLLSGSTGQAADTGKVFKASAEEPQPIAVAGDGNGFFGLDEGPASRLVESAPENGTIPAVVHDDQVVRSGAKVKLRLLQDMYLGSVKVPAQSFIYGRASISKERVEVEIRHAVAENNTVLPVKLAVFDTDGIPGISAPGADSRDAGRDGLNQAVQNLELYSMDPSIGAQAAASGIQAAKSLLSKKTKTAFAMLKAGHQVMLVNANF